MGSWGEAFFDCDGQEDTFDVFFENIFHCSETKNFNLLIKYAKSSELKKLLKSTRGEENEFSIMNALHEEDVMFKIRDLIKTPPQFLKPVTKASEAKSLSNLLCIEKSNYKGDKKQYESILLGKADIYKSYLQEYFTFNAVMHYKMNIMSAFPKEHVIPFIQSIDNSYRDIESWKSPKEKLKCLKNEMVPIFLDLYKKHHKLLNGQKVAVCPLMLKEIYNHPDYVVLEEQKILSKTIKMPSTRVREKFKI